MFSDITWGQFLTYLVPTIIAYGAVVLYLFYRKDVSNSVTSSRLVGKTVSSSPLASSPNGVTGVMGRTREQKTTVQPSSPTATAIVCEACGHEYGSPVLSPRLNSYGVPISNAVATPAPAAPLTVDFEPVDGEVDLSSMISALERVKSATTAAANGSSAETVISEKAAALTLFANDDLLNSEFASLAALQMDDAAPTEGYSAASSLDLLKAA